MRFLRYHGRVEAAAKLLPRLRTLLKGESAVVISLPRGGVVIGDVIARRLGVPHDIVVVRKIPEQKRPEWSVGAVTEQGDAIWNPKLKSSEDPSYLRDTVEAQLHEARRRVLYFRGGRGMPAVKGKTVILVDDGVARGWTMLAAIKTVRAHGAHRIIVAVPVAARDALERIRRAADDIVIDHTPRNFDIVGEYYVHFNQITDGRVKKLLRRTRRR